MSQGGRVVFVGGLGWVNGVEQAAAMRRTGISVTKVCPAPAGAGDRLRLLLDRLVFNEIRPELTDLDADLPDALADWILDQATIDASAVDLVGVGLARRRKEQHRATPRSLPDPLWYDKRYLAERLTELGIPGPQIWDTPTTDNYPVMVKVPVTTSGAGVRLCRDEDELRAAWSELGGTAGGAFLQEFIESPVTSVIGVAVDGQVIQQSTYEDIKSPDDPLGPSAHQVVVDRPDAARVARTLIRAVGHTGAFGMNMVRDTQGRYRVIDLNPRIPGGWTGLNLEGLPLLDAYLDAFNGRTTAHYASLPPGTVGTTLKFRPPASTGSPLLAWLKATEALLMRRRGLGWRFQTWAHARLVLEVMRGVRAALQTRGRATAAAARPAAVVSMSDADEHR